MFSEGLLDKVIYDEITLIDGNDFNAINMMHIYQKLYYNYPIIINISDPSCSVINNKLNLKEVKHYPECSPQERAIIQNIAEKYNGIIRNIYFSDCVFTEEFIIRNGYLYCDHSNATRLSKELNAFCPSINKIANVKYVAFANHGISINYFDIKEYKGNIALNYNDDLPLDTINDIIKKDRSSISILHGIPGSGKTSLLRYVINNNKDLNFYWLDTNMLSGMTQSSFVNFILNNRNAIYILEDCENLLTKRDDSNNNLLSYVLNISDGMLGDSLNVKFICTFNTDLDNIDPALLRKGRLALKYEFKELTSDKVEQLAKSLNINISENKSMPLCDIYNYQTDNGVNKKEYTKIGF